MTRGHRTDGRLDEFATVFEELTSRVLAGESIDWDAIKLEHPDHEHELDELLGTVGEIAGWGAKLAANTAHSPTPESQLRLLGDYRIVRELGRGGMGIVYEAEQMTLERRVALKVLPFAALLDKRRLLRFKNEARTAAMLKHPNIVSIHTVGHDKGVYYFAMELVEGNTLTQLIEARDASELTGKSNSKTSAQLSTKSESSNFFRAVAEVGVQVAEALSYAHEQGVVHRDIKPSNILVDDMGEVRVADFGLARFAEDQNLTQSGDLLGTLRYMSPEQVTDGATADHRSDIYSLGATLYEVALGRPLWPGDGQLELVKQITEHAPTRPSQCARGTPKDFERILMKATEREPLDRYLTANDFADDLNRFLQGRSVRAERASAVSRFFKLAKRYPVASASIALLLLSMMIGLGTTAFLLNRAVEAEASTSQALYAYKINAAYAAWERSDLDRVEELLQACASHPETEPGVEWSFLANQLKQTESELLIQCDETAHHVEYSPDGSMLVATFPSGKTTVWDAASRRELWTAIADHAAGASFSLDGRRILLSLTVNEECIRDAQTGRILERIRIDDDSDRPQYGGTFLPDDRGTVHILTKRGDRLTDVFIRDMAGNTRKVDSLHDRNVQMLRVSPRADNVVIVERDNSISICDVETLTPHQRIGNDHALTRSVSFSGDGTILATGAGANPLASDTQLHFWNLKSGKEFFPLPKKDAIGNGIAISPKHNMAAVFGAEPGEVAVWDINEGVSRRLLGHRAQVVQAVWNPDGKTLVTVGDDSAIRFWNIDVSPSGERVSRKSPLVSLAVAAPYAFVTLQYPSAYKTPSKIYRYNIYTNSLQGVANTSSNVTGLCVLKNQLASVSVDAGCQLWSIQDFPKLIETLETRSWSSELCVGPRGHTLAIGKFGFEPKHARTSFIEIWQRDESEWKLSTKLDEMTWPMALSINPEETMIVSGEEDGCVRVWNITSGEEVWNARLHSAAVHCARFSDDGNLVASGGEDRMVRIWDVKNGSCIAVFQHHWNVFALEFCDQDRRLVTGTAGGRLQFWDVQNGYDLGSFKCDDLTVGAIEASPDDLSLVTAFSDGRIAVHDLGKHETDDR